MRSALTLAAVAVAALAVAAPVPKKGAEKPTPEQAVEEARTRWNKAAGDTGPQWKEGFFPHPTFADGSAKAYGDFARVLVKFLDEKGTFEYLTENALADAPLAYSKLKVNWTFAKLIADFAKDDAHGDHDADTRKALRDRAKALDAAKK